ncbi:ImmA/IrrE family metallo-endopeptidase [Sphingomonas sp. dw_22]|uniref:ImmA/IrrE family metallo-endopeptidase n=1 Tax=Sphingomonas sp. dw_22 TaxID=2721175 RepID=UPI0021167929|nr:ImmA/IrrE family metallo-endopeptidase [Sphingomonas sp. dw_22]
MRRGFKADAERRAEAARTDLGLDPLAKLDPWVYAAKLGVLVFDVNDLDLDPAHVSQLLVHDPDSWSGMTLDEDGVRLIVLNNAQSKRRQCSTLMHELSHLILEHVPASVNVSPSGLTLLSDYSDEQEEEADWLGAALLLPQAALLHHRSTGSSMQEIARHFGVSDDLCSWRCRMTGVEKRLAFRARA